MSPVFQENVAGRQQFIQKSVNRWFSL